MGVPPRTCPTTRPQLGAGSHLTHATHTRPSHMPLHPPQLGAGGHLSHGYQTDTKKISATSIFFEVGQGGPTPAGPV